MKLTGYCMGLKRVVEITEPELVTMKNGCKAVKGLAADDLKYRAFRILGADEAKEVEAMLRS